MANVTPVGKSYQRLGNFAIDSTEVWADLASATEYASTAVAYEGQIIRVLSTDGNAYHTYIINKNKTLSLVGGGSGGGDVVTVNSVAPDISGNVILGAENIPYDENRTVRQTLNQKMNVDDFFGVSATRAVNEANTISDQSSTESTKKIHTLTKQEWQTMYDEDKLNSNTFYFVDGSMLTRGKTVIADKTISPVDAKVYALTLVDGKTTLVETANKVYISELAEKVNLLTGVYGKVIVVDAAADLTSIPSPSSRDIAFVTEDENHANGTTMYVYEDSWMFVGKIAVEIRDFDSDPIDLSLETSGVLPKNKIDMVSIISGVLDYLPETSDNSVPYSLTLEAEGFSTEEIGNQTIGFNTSGYDEQHGITEDGTMDVKLRTGTSYSVVAKTSPIPPLELIYNPQASFTTGSLPIPKKQTLSYISKDFTNNEYVHKMKDVIEQNRGIEYDAMLIGDLSEFGEKNKWCGGVLAPNENIYCIPTNSRNVLKIDTSNDTYSILDTDLSDDASKWVGGVLAPNGCIYGIPRMSKSILKIDTLTDTVTTFGEIIEQESGEVEWLGGILAPNGCIYGIPLSGSTILKIDPSTDTYTTFNSFSDVYKKKNNWCAGTLSSDGIIYAMPHVATEVLKIDTNNDTCTVFGELPVAGNKWSGGVISPDNYIYSAPFNRVVNQICKIDISNDTVSLLEDEDIVIEDIGNAGKWSTGVLAPNGCIYFIPYGALSILKIDTEDDSISAFGNFEYKFDEYGVFSNKWHSGVLAPNGCIYGIPHHHSSILKIYPKTELNAMFEPNTLRSAYLNKF